MICNGKCKKCGMFREKPMENVKTGKTEIVKQCLFDFAYDQLVWINQHLGALHTAENSTRNDVVKTLGGIHSIFKTAQERINNNAKPAIDTPGNGGKIITNSRPTGTRQGGLD